jgi:4-hydroxythreonine-4-phosphate dehydrogenase
MSRPLAVTLGEPAGIGPDITLIAWQRRAELALPPFYLLADPDLMRRRAQRLAPDAALAVVEPGEAVAAFGSALPVVDIGVTVTAEPGRPDASSAPAAIAAIRRAVADVGPAWRTPPSPIRSPSDTAGLRCPRREYLKHRGVAAFFIRS